MTVFLLVLSFLANLLVAIAIGTLWIPLGIIGFVYFGFASIIGYNEFYYRRHKGRESQ